MQSLSAAISVTCWALQRKIQKSFYSSAAFTSEQAVAGLTALRKSCTAEQQMQKLLGKHVGKCAGNNKCIRIFKKVFHGTYRRIRNVFKHICTFYERKFISGYFLGAEMDTS